MLVISLDFFFCQVWFFKLCDNPMQVSSRLATPSARGRRHNTGSARLHSRNQWIDQHLAVEDGRDSYADLADWIVPDEEASDDEPALPAVTANV
jgi:hypothetical protein